MDDLECQSCLLVHVIFFAVLFGIFDHFTKDYFQTSRDLNITHSIAFEIIYLVAAPNANDFGVPTLHRMVLAHYLYHLTLLLLFIPYQSLKSLIINCLGVSSFLYVFLQEILYSPGEKTVFWILYMCCIPLLLNHLSMIYERRGKYLPLVFKWKHVYSYSLLALPSLDLMFICSRIYGTQYWSIFETWTVALPYLIFGCCLHYWALCARLSYEPQEVNRPTINESIKRKIKQSQNKIK